MPCSGIKAGKQQSRPNSVVTIPVAKGGLEDVQSADILSFDPADENRYRPPEGAT